MSVISVGGRRYAANLRWLERAGRRGAGRDGLGLDGARRAARVDRGARREADAVTAAAAAVRSAGFPNTTAPGGTAARGPMTAGFVPTGTPHLATPGRTAGRDALPAREPSHGRRRAKPSDLLNAGNEPECEP